MKQIAAILVLLFYNGYLHAKSTEHDLEQILFQAYDSIRNEMLKTACEIGGIKDSAFLKEISEGRVDSAIAHRHVNTNVAQLLQQSNRTISGTDHQKYDTAVRTVRANLMGRLMIQNYRNEETILQRFDIHRKGLDSLFIEASDYMKALKDTTLSDFQKKYPNSKFCALIQSKSGKDRGVSNYLYIAIVTVVALAVLLAMLYFAYELKKSKKSLIAMQNQMNRQHEGQNEQINGQTNIPLQTDSTVPSQQSNVEETAQILNPKVNDTDTQNEKFDMGNVNAFAENHDGWTVVGTSIIGNSHISMGLPCQDNNKYVYLKNGWGIAITSDGAGSAQHSDVGSRIVVERGIHYFQSVIEQKQWAERNVLPTEAEWTSIAYTTLKAIRTDMEKFAATKHLELSSLSATIIVAIHTPLGFLTTHVGDGRAGYKDDTGEWKALITPHKGEEANQTIFITSDFWNLPYYVMSGVMVPESHVVHCRPVAFTLMSDGCEHTAWQCNMKNQNTGVFYDPNKPFERFFNPVVADLSNGTMNDLKTRWARFITQGNGSFKNESDDKTMILGALK